MKETINKVGIVTLTIVTVNSIALLINVAVGGGSYLWLFLSGGGYVKDYGEAAFQAIILEHEWWRLLTCGYLHIGVFHLFFNIYAMLIVVGKLEKSLGHFNLFLCYHVGIVITAFIWILFFRNGSIVGASLGIYVTLGMLIMLSRRGKAGEGLLLSKGQRNYLISYFLVSCLLGVGTIVVHIIGFAVGVIFGWLYTRRKRFEPCHVVAVWLKQLL